MNQATVRAFLATLTGRFTRYDEKQQQKGRSNPYALAHYMGAVSKVEGKLKKYLDRDDPQAMEALKAALMQGFTNSGGRFDLPPVNQVSRMMDAWLAAGKLPKYGSSPEGQLRRQVVRLAHANPELRKDLLPLLKDMRLAGRDSKNASPGILVQNLEFASGQEPEDSEDFVTLVRVSFQVQGQGLAKVLGKQLRVLEKTLESVNPKKLLHAIESSQEVLRAIAPQMRAFVAEHFLSLDMDPPQHTQVDWASSSDYPNSVKIEHGKGVAHFEMEFDMWSL